MTRTKEVDPDSGKIPEYKSPANRLVHSLRKGYDNVRSKLKATREQIKYFQIKTRDLEKSRAHYKEEVLVLKKTIDQIEKENQRLKMLVGDNEVKKKKKNY